MARFIVVHREGYPEEIYQLKGILKWTTNLEEIRKALEYELNIPIRDFTWDFVDPLVKKLQVPKASSPIPPPPPKKEPYKAGVDFMAREVESKEALMLGELQALKYQLKIEIDANAVLRSKNKELTGSVYSKNKQIDDLERFKRETIEGLVHMANFRNWYQRTLDER